MGNRVTGSPSVVSGDVWLGPIGTALPPSAWPQDRIVELGVIAAGDEARRGRVRSVFSRAGVRNRSLAVTNDNGPWFYDRPDLPTTAERMRLYHHAAADLAATASASALADAGVSSGDITHLVTASCTGFQAPGVDITLIERLALPPATQRTHVGYMGCHAAINALRAAAALASQDPRARVLVCCVEICSIHLQHADTPERDIVNALFADGAGACVVSQKEPRDAAGKNAVGRLVSTSSMLWPDTRDLMQWRIGNHGFEMVLGRDVPKAIREHTQAWLAEWLSQASLEIDDVDAWAIHPGGPHIIDAAAEALGLGPSDTSASRRVLTEHGNMSSATLMFVLDALARETSFKHLVGIAFGPGLAGEAIRIER